MTDTPKPLGLDHMGYVGMIATAWAHLEHAVDSTCWRLAKVQPEVGACFTANLGSIHLKLRSLRALAELRGAKKELLNDITSYQGRVSGTAEKRNRIVHDPWVPVPTSAGVEFGQQVIRADSRGREFGKKPVPISYMAETGQEITQRIYELFKFRERFAAELPAFGKKLP